MLKNIALVLCVSYVVVIGDLSAQERAKKFQFEFGYGMSIAGDFEKNTYHTTNDFDFGTPTVGKNIEATIKYVFKNKRFIGFGVTVQSYTNTLNGSDNINGNVLTFENYRLEEEIQYYELQYGKFFNNGLDLTLSFFSIYYYQPLLSVTPVVVLRNTERLDDDFGLGVGLGYKLYQNNAINISLRAKIAVSLNGLEAITLTPLVRFNF